MKIIYCDGCKKEMKVDVVPGEQRAWISVIFNNGSRIIGHLDLCPDCIKAPSWWDKVSNWSHIMIMKAIPHDGG